LFPVLEPCDWNIVDIAPAWLLVVVLDCCCLAAGITCCDEAELSL
jgi:hypothetical protein